MAYIQLVVTLVRFSVPRLADCLVCLLREEWAEYNIEERLLLGFKYLFPAKLDFVLKNFKTSSGFTFGSVALSYHTIEMGEADSEEPAADLIAGSAAEGKETFRNCNKRKEEKKSVANLSCLVCGALHMSEVMLVKHAWSHGNDPGSVCGACGERSESVEVLKDHLQSRHKTDDCHICGESLSRHKMTHSGERPHSCKICGRRFKLPGTLRQHEKIHTNRERSYLCDICCKMFLTSAQLEIHMRIHTNEKPYHCSECGKGFSTKGPLTVHKRVHSGETPYHCPDCGWSFKRKTNLDNHLVLHSGIKPFVCGICGKACARKEYLTVHMRTHNGERPYKCTLCDKAFTQSHCLKTHMKSHQAPGSATNYLHWHSFSSLGLLQQNKGMTQGHLIQL
uniref:Zinc finger protein 2 homolog n=1 Tax=Maylandia zebra TaxID=106582 RepID=A0A3P9DSX1_9CICH